MYCVVLVSSQSRQDCNVSDGRRDVGQTWVGSTDDNIRDSDMIVFCAVNYQLVRMLFEISV